MQTHCPPAHNVTHTQHIDLKEAGTYRVRVVYTGGVCVWAVRLIIITLHLTQTDLSLRPILDDLYLQM